MSTRESFIHVRKQIPKIGNPRYRYSKGRVDLSLADLKSLKGFKFKYGVSINAQDIDTVEILWENKLIAGKHLFRVK